VDWRRPVAMIGVQCPLCHNYDLVLRWQGERIRADCCGCGKLVRFVSLDEVHEAVSELPPRPDPKTPTVPDGPKA
jgi:hypothetical protein